MACLLAGIYVLVLVIVAANSRLPQYKTRFRHPEGHCQGCDYDLAGLVEGTRCPECGRPDAGAPEVVPARSIIKPVVIGRLAAISVFVGLACLVYGWAVHLAGAWSYVAQGYRLDVAIRASEIRAEDHLLAFWVLNPWPWTVVLAPALASLPADRKGERRLWLTLVGSLVAGLASLAVVAALWRGG